MVIVPAIDVRAARVVMRGGMTREMPSEVARRYAREGAQELHLVDLDAAEGSGDNLALLTAVARSCGIPARLAGGLCSVELAAEALDAGFSGVCFSSAIFGDDGRLRAAARLPGAIVEIEVRDGWLAPRGGEPALVEIAQGRGVLAAADAAARAGVPDLYVIDVGAEGALGGPALDLLDGVRQALGQAAARTRIHAGGGIRGLEDIRALAQWGAASAVVGRALAEGRFGIAEARLAALGTLA